MRNGSARTLDDLLAQLRESLATGDAFQIEQVARDSAPGDWSSIIFRLEDSEVQSLLASLPEDEPTELLSEIEPIEAAQIVQTVLRPRASALLEAMAPDDATDVIDAMPEGQAEQILIQMEPVSADEIHELLEFPADSAGGVMTPGFVAISPTLPATQAIAALQRVSEEDEVWKNRPQRTSND